MKEDKYTKRLAKNQVCAIFQMRDIRKNDLPKFIKLCVETPCWSSLRSRRVEVAGERVPTTSKRLLRRLMLERCMTL